MSAIDFANGNTSQSSANYGATRRYYTLAFPTLPDSDWCTGCWFRAVTNTDGTTSYPGFYSHPNEITTPSPAFKVNFLATTTLQFQARLDASTSGTATTHSVIVTHGITFGAGTDFLVVWQRRSGVLQAYVVQEGTTASAPNGTATITGTPNPGTIPSTSGGFFGTGHYGGTTWADGFINPLGEFFLFNDRSLSAANVTTLAAGARPSTATVGGDPLILLPFRTLDAATETNLGTGGATYNATKAGTTFTTAVSDFFALSASTGSRLSLMNVG